MTTPSGTTIATLPRLSREALAGLILTTSSSSSESTSSSTSAPTTTASDSTSTSTPTPPSKPAIIDVRDSDHVGGHIAGSIHAPTPTLDWKMPELVRELQNKDTVVFHCALSQQRGPGAALRYLRERERMGVGVGGEGKKQKVYVLEGGFVEWQEKYGRDGRLTEGYDEEVWRDGY